MLCVGYVFVSDLYFPYYGVVFYPFLFLALLCLLTINMSVFCAYNRCGEPGMNGLDGISGINGKNGADELRVGMKGFDGTHGTNGSNGTKGCDGTNGAKASDMVIELRGNVQQPEAYVNGVPSILFFASPTALARTAVEQIDPFADLPLPHRPLHVIPNTQMEERKPGIVYVDASGGDGGKAGNGGSGGIVVIVFQFPPVPVDCGNLCLTVIVLCFGALSCR